MKRIVTVLVILTIAISNIFAQESLRDVVKDYQNNNSEFTLVIPSFLIKMGAAFGDLDEEEKEMLSQIHDMKIVISESQFQKSDFTLLEDGIKSGNFQEVMTINDGGEKVRMIMNKKSDRKSEMLMLVESYNENVLMLFDFHGEPDFKKLLSLAD
ncbi:MAG: DUF4252 domain-containing protein [Bacteroidales bacterium]|nr:DUF4252 domain-containing protein [Bacteroidales bacterium]